VLRHWLPDLLEVGDQRLAMTAPRLLPFYRGPEPEKG
jgi:hypothetical protein